jgi:cytoskeletal protein CcmA (bactofilin family)
MSIFKRAKKGPPQGKAEKADTQAAAKSAAETSPQKVGVVSSVLPTGSAAGASTPFSDVVAKRFGPSDGGKGGKGAAADAPTVAEPRPSATGAAGEGSPPSAPHASAEGTTPEHSHLDPAQRVEPLFTSEEPELETDPMANIGRATTITGNIVAEEDLEIHGTVEGSVRLVEHQVTVGSEGVVKASVEANIVLVHGKITGDVTAADLVEVKPGGIVGGDVKAPRLIMHDGAVIVGGLDMSSALPSSASTSKAESEARTIPETAKNTERPVLKKVELPPVHSTADGQSIQG